MSRAAIYARYSSDLQSAASIEDQVRLCEERTAREGWHIVQRYADRGMSGASLIRPCIQALLHDAADRRFEIVLTESLDRLSRDQEDIAGVHKRLRFAGVKIITLSEGEIAELQIGFKGTMSALYLKDLADKTRRGLRGRVEAGRSGGGNCYGYNVVPRFNAFGAAERGERSINGAQATVVRQIFEAYTAGTSPKAIALALNRQGVPGPSGKGWGSSTINGNWQRGTGILNNELYIGRLVWNRLTYIKNPDTGNRVSRLNPASGWIARDVPALRIVDQELWETSKARQRGLQKLPEFHQRQRPRMLLSYLLACGCCGGGMSKVSKNHYGCSTARNKGTCQNHLIVRQDALEGMVVGALQSRLMDPALLDIFCQEYTSHLNKLRNEKNAAFGAAKDELAKLAKSRDRLVQAIKDGVPAIEVKDDLASVAARRQELELLLANKKEAPVLLHPGMAEHYHQQVAALAVALTAEATRTEAADLLRALIDRIVLTPDETGMKLQIDLYGDLAGILGLAANKDRPLDDSDPSVRQVKLVAGAGFEPAAFRL